MKQIDYFDLNIQMLFFYRPQDEDKDRWRCQNLISERKDEYYATKQFAQRELNIYRYL